MAEAQRVRMAALGLGRCGGRFAAAAARRGWPAIALDTSRADLRSLTDLPEESRIYIGIDDVEGTGGAAELGAECLRARRETLHPALDALGRPDLLVLAAGLGGGTGANLALLAELASDRSLGILALGVLPASSDPHAAKLNALRAVNALVDAPVAARTWVDNQQMLARYAERSLADYEQEGNADALAALDGLGRLTASGDTTPLRSLDPAQWLACLRAGGVSVAGSSPVQAPLSADALLATVRQILDEPAVFAGGYRLEDVAGLGLILELDAETLSTTPAKVLAELSEQVRVGVVAGDVFVGLYETRGGESRLHLVAGGLPLPARPRELLAEAAAEAERLAERRSAWGGLEKLDLSALEAHLANGPLAAPSTSGKGMVKSRLPVPSNPTKTNE